MRQSLTGAIQEGCRPLGADTHPGEALDLLQMSVLLAEKGMGQLGIGRFKSLPLYGIVQEESLLFQNGYAVSASIKTLNPRTSLHIH